MSELFDKTAQELGPGTSQFKVLVFLAFRNASTPSVISEETGILPGTVRPALRALLEKGYVKQGEDGTYKSVIPFTDIISTLYVINKK